MLGPHHASARSALRYAAISILVLLLASCADTKPPTDEPVSLCCMTKDGDAAMMTNVACKDASGISVDLDFCDEDLVSLCCETPDGATSYMTNVECAEAKGLHVAIAECQEDPPTYCCVVDGVYSFVSNAQDCADAGGQPTSGDFCAEVCCSIEGQPTAFMTLGACHDQSGSIVSDEACLGIEEVCCKTDQGPQWVPAADCDPSQVQPVELCEEEPEVVCCDTPNFGPLFVLFAACDPANVLPDTQCHEDEIVCCETPNGPAFLLGSQCYPGTILPDQLCEDPTEDVCCETPNGVMWMTATDCPSNQVLPNAMCEELDPDVCCKLDGGNQWVPASQCPPGQVQPDSACEDPVPDVCCETEQGPMVVPASDCDPANLLPMDQCESPVLVCCETENGVMWMTATDCPSNQVLPDAMCEEPDPDVCCKLDGGNQWVPASQCPPGQLQPDSACEDPLPDVCCETEQGPMVVPAADCDAANLLTMDQCESPVLVCCETPNGVMWVPAIDCGAAQTLPDAMCEEVDPDVCCKLAAGNQWVPASQCPPGQIQPDSACEDPVPDVCCDTEMGPMLVPATDCVPASVLTMDQCESPVQVCCETAAGVMWMNATDCPSNQVLPDAMCEEDPPPGLTTCVAFQAIDMAGLPYTLNTGVTLQSYLGTGPYTQVPASNGCSTVPVNGERGFAGVGSDGPVVFDTPITSFYILQLNVQEGDDLTFAEPNTITQMGCAPGGTAGNAYYRVDLDTPQTTVTVQDIDPGGGSGYSYMIAECIEEVDAVCCDTATGPAIVAAGQCDPALVLPDASCMEDPPPPNDLTCVHWTLIDMAALPHTMGSGTTLSSYTGLGPFLGDVPSSNGCSTVPPDSSRGFAGVGSDGVVEFDAPVSELYVAAFHVQTGDDLMTMPAATATDTGCNLSNASGGTLHYVELDTASAQVTVQDLDPEGGSGYSFMIAECTEWAEEPVEDVCCETELGLMIVPATDCPPAQVLPMDECEPPPELVCCETAAGVMWVPVNQCGAAQVLPDAMCEEPDPDVCCKLDGGNQWVPASQCPPGQIQPDSTCEDPLPDVCCDTEQGSTLVPAGDCPPGNLLTMDQCESPALVCCETAAGVQWVSAADCDPGLTLPDSSCDEGPGLTVCSAFQAIDMAGLPYTLNTGVTLQTYLGGGPYTGVPVSNGCSTVPLDGERGYAGVDSDGPVVFDAPISSFYILQLNVQTGDDLTFAEPNTITQMGCAPGGTAGNAYYRVDLDTPQTTVTVQDIDPGGGSGYSFMIAECLEEEPAVCCDSGTGPVVIATDLCDAADVLPDASCTDDPPPVEDPVCVHYTAIDMAALPFTMASGVTLDSYSGIGPLLGGVPASSACNTVPANASRGFAGVDSDGVVTFDAPITEFYIAQFHVQVGDDLMTSPTSTSTAQGCSLGDAGGGDYHHVVLDTPASQVSIQDLDPDGGTGYSFMIAECTEWETE